MRWRVLIARPILRAAFTARRASAALALFAAACAEDPPSSEASGGGAGNAPRFGSSECRTCLDPVCREPLSSCRADRDCAAWLACVEACPLRADGHVDGECEARCPIGTQRADALRAAFGFCRADSASAACPACDAVPAGGGAPHACVLPAAAEQQCAVSDYEGCTKCLQEECCESDRGIETAGPGENLSVCWLACEDGACRAACFAAHPEGIPLFGAHRACYAARCSAKPDCAPLNDDSCEACLVNVCNCEIAGCFADFDCYRQLECRANCSDAACAAACDALPSGGAPWRNLVACSAPSCASACPRLR